VGILDEDVVRVRESTDLIALVSEHLALKRVGRRFVGLCPFHQEKTPSFGVNPEMGRYYCFGCNASGDAISFVREIEHLDFVEAVERLASRAGIQLRYDDRRAGEAKSRQSRLREVVAEAITFYHRLLLESAEGGAARRYLRSRGFDGDAARRFELGWAPDAWDSLSRHLQQKGCKRDDIVDAGLAFVNRANKLQDQFRARLLFPIYDARGEPSGFGGRALGNDGPKYKNSPENPIYQKSRLLYGLNWAKGEIVARGEVVVCEGYTDVMAFALAGAPHAVATCGTALTDDHVQLLKNFARKVVLAYDADAAGQGAAEKWYRWEQEFEIQVRVADLPPGRDPADVWRDDPALLVQALERAEPFLQFRVDRLLGVADLSTLEGKARAGEAAAGIVAQHPSDLVRDQYAMQLAGRLQIDVDRLRGAIESRVGGGPRPGDRGAAARGGAPGRDRGPRDRGNGRSGGANARTNGDERRREPVRVDRREEDVLRWAVHEPAVVADWLDAPLLSDPVARAAFVSLAGAATFDDALESSSGPVRELLERLAVEEPDHGELDDRATIGARVMVNTVAPRAEEVIERMLDEGDERVSEVKAALDRLRHARDFGDWPAAREAARQLLGWIGESPGSRAPEMQVGAPHATTEESETTQASEDHGPTVTG
jgi:DNA primase